MTKQERAQIIQDIKMLINSSDEKLIEINPKLLEYFTDEEILEVKEDLILKKQNWSQNSQEWLEEIYNKTSK